MKKVLTVLFVILAVLIANNSYAETISLNNSHNNNDFSKTYKTSSENLLYLLLSALNENNYSIEEIQFKTGSVLFKAYSKEFIASVASQDSINSFIKIIPVDNNYNFSPILIDKLHKYLEMNTNIIFKKVI